MPFLIPGQYPLSRLSAGVRITHRIEIEGRQSYDTYHDITCDITYDNVAIMQKAVLMQPLSRQLFKLQFLLGNESHFPGNNML